MTNVRRVLIAGCCLVAGIAAGCATGGDAPRAERPNTGPLHVRNGTTTYVVTTADGTSECVWTANAGICEGPANTIEGFLRSAPRPQPELRRRVVRATVREWSNEEGWGVLSAAEIRSGGIWAHFSAIEMEGFKTLAPGQPVLVEVVGPLPFEQDGYRFRALWVRPLSRGAR